MPMESPPLKLILNPILILEDTSFAQDLKVLGQMAFKIIIKLLIGNGLGSVRVSDGLYNKLFIGVGLIGFLTYLSIVIIMFSKFQNLRFLLLFIMLNAVTMETTVHSFRSMQVVIPIICFLLVQQGQISRHFIQRTPK